MRLNRRNRDKNQCEFFWRENAEASKETVTGRVLHDPVKASGANGFSLIIEVPQRPIAVARHWYHSVYRTADWRRGGNLEMMARDKIVSS